MSRSPTERDLRHDAPSERFGNAMLKCQNVSGECMSSGYCIYGGCFDRRAHIEAARMIETLIPKDGRAGIYYAYLRQCAKMLRDGRIRI